MAAPTCTFCQEYQAVFMGTSMEDGETFCACGLCLPGVMLGMTAALVQGMPADEAQSHAEAFNSILSVYTPPAPAKASRKRSGSSVATAPDPETTKNGAIPGEQPLIDECAGCGNLVDVMPDGSVNCGTCGTTSTPVANTA